MAGEMGTGGRSQRVTAGARGIALLLAVAVATGGCTLAVKGPRPHAPPSEPPACHSSAPLAKLGDSLIAAPLGLGGLALLGLMLIPVEGERAVDNEPDKLVIPIAAIALSGFLFGSVILSVRRTDACQEAKRVHAAWRAQSPDRQRDHCETRARSERARCPQSLDRYRSESDPERKALLYRDLPASCRQILEGAAAAPPCDD